MKVNIIRLRDHNVYLWAWSVLIIVNLNMIIAWWITSIIRNNSEVWQFTNKNTLPWISCYQFISSCATCNWTGSPTAVCGKQLTCILYCWRTYDFIWLCYTIRSGCIIRAAAPLLQCFRIITIFCCCWSLLAWAAIYSWTRLKKSCLQVPSLKRLHQTSVRLLSVSS